MNAAEFDSIVNKQLDICRRKLVEKAEEYATKDRLHNFKVAAKLEKLTPIQALEGMMAKHTVSIYDMCNSDVYFPLCLWDEKITDHINYLILLKALVIEDMAGAGKSEYIIEDGNGNSIDLET